MENTEDMCIELKKGLELYGDNSEEVHSLLKNPERRGGTYERHQLRYVKEFLC